MELTNEFRVDRPVDETWNVLTDVERIAPALPGAQLQEIEGDEYRGIVKVKVGPITAQYKGKATFVEKDDTNHKAVLKAEGRDTKGQGNASALITATLDARWCRHEGQRAHRPDGHGQGGTVRPGHHGGREHQAARPVRRAASRRRSWRATQATRAPRRSPTGRWRWRRLNRKRRLRRRTRRRRPRSVGSIIPSQSRSISWPWRARRSRSGWCRSRSAGCLLFLFVRGLRRRTTGVRWTTPTPSPSCWAERQRCAFDVVVRDADGSPS